MRNIKRLIERFTDIVKRNTFGYFSIKLPKTNGKNKLRISAELRIIPPISFVTSKY
jgi:hypothetical protein